ncbi:type II toxin-antitoxin system VapC family toxin [Leucobacter coleopterorum]|uniref:Ribonuclease VapC n=1 Tax=Leucobacter coleopterorum TaxID=2714933 RepID=A0ABX6JX78_9MICO|nr:type II toxin-antitoxin system VapC family toxin [Leucobacter coleopterorum]QIM18911.1 type II toxin-antitoxin system VapC family toxin [Leucobacter coleopterorum]
MIIDTSVVVAVLRQEPGFEALVEVLVAEPAPSMSAASYVETCAVLARTQEQQSLVDDLLRVFSVQIIPFDTKQAKFAAAAYQQFGRGSGHRAKLNLGDAYSYALAKAQGEPLLFVGDDFVHTDVMVVHK